ncbi:MAG: Rieske (2Fe-2S) protein, partial [Bacteroidales bacterium]|nr:Rieske (2Fe-2S) protein [Bacteroidales bacterium]
MTAKMQRPAGRSPGESWQDILARSKVRAPDFLWEDSHRNLDNAPLAADRYTGDKFFRAECERMWPSVWQFAARDEELQNPGDFVVYENAGRSYLVVRQQDDSVKAFHNVCLHRGRKLRTEGGAANEFQCPFHGFSWHLDGTLKDIPCRWDFPHLKDDAMTLPEASVASWQGYIFVRENTE